MGRFLRLFVWVAVSLNSTQVLAEQATLAVAANFTAPIKALAEQFEAQSEHRLVLAFGSSGKLFAQIQHGAPFDVFFSADREKPQVLRQARQTASRPFTYAIGKLVLWSANEGLFTHAEAYLAWGEYRKIALANPRLAPYGAAAVEVLTALELKKQTQSQWVQGENIAQTYHFVASGNAPLGFVALSQVMDDGEIKKGAYWVVPTNLYQPIKQDAVLLKRARHNNAANAFIEFLQSPQAQAIITAYGYNLE
jgi:molybdate transport system substrate-binding protein